MKTLTDFLLNYWLPILSVAFLIFAIIIIRRALKEAKEMPPEFEVLTRAEMSMIKQHLDKKCPDKICPDEHSPEAYFGDDKEIEELKERLHKDYNDEDVDQNFMNGLN